MSNVGFIGGGLAMRDLHVPALRSLGLIERVTRVATSNCESARAAAEWLHTQGADQCMACDVDEVLADPNVAMVLIAVPIEFSEAIARRVLEAGKPALVEKPIATTTAAAVDLLQLARRNDVPLLAGENFRFKPEFARMRALASQGVVGQVKILYWNDLHFTPDSGKYAQTSWRIAGRHRGGYLIDGGTHIVAGLRQMTGAAVTSVHALATASQDYLSQQEDTLLMNLAFDDGTIGHLALGYGVYDPDARRPKLCGDTGTLALLDDGIYLVDTEGSRKVAAREGGAGFVEEWQLLQQAVEGDGEAVRRTFAMTLESIKDLQLIECALLSSKSGQRVDLPAVA